MLETDVCPGDEYRIGSAVMRVTTPRLPCFKLAAKFRRDDMIERFLKSGFSGFYFSVVAEGEVGAGDEVTLLKRDEHRVTIAEVNHLYISHSPDVELLRRAAEVEALPESWRQRFLSKLEDTANPRVI
jgi:MOSC domain-containing protein YiiM